MGETSIEWTDYTFNPWIGCQKVSAGCANCYAEIDTYSRVSKSRGLPLWGPKAKRHRTSEANWRKPLAWNRAAKEAREERARLAAEVPWVRPKVFCASLADVFEDYRGEAEGVDLDAWRADLWKLIEACPELDWLLLTKRPENVLRMVPPQWIGAPSISEAGKPLGIFVGWPGHVFVGTSVEDQKAADERIPHLLKVPAPVRFLSMEPLLGPVDLRNIPANIEPVEGAPWWDYFSALSGNPWDPQAAEEVANDTKYPRIHWVIVGGESGPKARAFDVAWAREIIRQCRNVGVPVFCKQLGAEPYDSNTNMGDYPDGYEFGPAPPCAPGFAAASLPLLDRKGGDWGEWPEDLRVQEMPR